MNAQADPNFRRAHESEGTVSDVVLHLKTSHTMMKQVLGLDYKPKGRVGK